MESISLSELCEAVRESIRMDFSDRLWVRAEISSLSAKPGGHCYMELVESGTANGGRSDLKAKVKANCWSNIWTMLSAYFQQTTDMPMQVGMQVLLEVTVDFHPVYGFSLTVLNVNPEYTLGDMARQRQQTIDRLREEGMMELQPSLSVPTLLRCIAIVSAADAAGYQDFIHQLLQGGFAFRTTLFPAIMQGENAPKSIMQALDSIYEKGDYEIVVIIRGGGATTDLSCFDNYALCSYCAQFPLPILSGVGHTRDVSVLDMVAYHAVKTPTAAAEWLLDRMQQQTERLDALSLRLQQTALRQITLRRERLLHLEAMLQLHLHQALNTERQHLTLLEKTIQLHSPEAIFAKGYSLVLHDGQPVRSVSQLTVGSSITAYFADGEALANVEKISRK